MSATFSEVAEMLAADGHAVEVERECLVVWADDDARFEVGTVNGPWEIDLEDVRGEVQQLPGGGLPDSSTAREVADWVALAVENYREASRGPVTDEERSNGPRS